MPYDQEVVDGVREILNRLGDPSINQMLNEQIAGQKQRNHLLLNTLADILEHKFLVVHSMEQSILNSMSQLGLANEVRIGDDDEENDYIISSKTVSARGEQLEPIRVLVDALREDAVRCEEYDKVRVDK